MTDSNQVQLVAYLEAKPGKEQDLIDAVLGIVPAVLKEPGCIEYLPHVSRENAALVVMYEVWSDQAALDTHAKGENLGALAARFEELLASPLRLEALRRLN